MRRLALLLVALPSAALAEPTFFSEDGDEYAVAYTTNGAVLTSLYPKAWPHLEPSEDHVTVRKPAIVVLGNDCQALHNEWGSGTWEQDNGGFSVVFGSGHQLRFTRQEIGGPASVMESNCLWLPGNGGSGAGN